MINELGNRGFWTEFYRLWPFWGLIFFQFSAQHPRISQKKNNVKGFFLRNWSLITCFFFTENNNIHNKRESKYHFCCESCKSKILRSKHKVRVTNVKVPVTTIFRNTREFSCLPVTILEKMTVKFLTLPVTIFDNMPVSSEKCPWQNSKIHLSRAFGVSLEKNKHWYVLVFKMWYGNLSVTNVF